MRRNFVIGAIILLVIAGGVGWYFGSPYYALNQMRAAAQAGDTDRFASYIDFPALRASMKEELKAKAAAEMMKGEQDGFAALGSALAMGMVDGMVDGMVTPASVRAAFAASKSANDQPVLGGVDASKADLKLERVSVDQFRLVDPAKPDTGLIFTRDGLGWKLSALRLGSNE